MPKRVPVIVNRQGGTAGRAGDKLRGQVEDAFAAAGLEIDLRLVDGESVAGEVERVQGAPTVVVGGGDGTVSGAAAIVAGTDTALGILPLGTRNHLARDLGLPLDLPGAAAVIAAGQRRRIDLGRVGDRVFVNNASIGFYPAMVEQRDGAAAPKWLAALPAALATLRRLPHHRLRLALAGQQQQVVTPMLFIGNGRYSLDLGSLGRRTDLSDGKLSIYAVARRGRLALIGMAVRTLLGRADREHDFAALEEAHSLTVSGPRRPLHVALDGEVLHLAAPLEFRCDPGVLTVIAPPA